MSGGTRVLELAADNMEAAPWHGAHSTLIIAREAEPSQSGHW
jgi:hypothetical protein